MHTNGSPRAAAAAGRVGLRIVDGVGLMMIFNPGWLEDMVREDAMHVTEQLDWHNDPPPRFFPDQARDVYARSWLVRLTNGGPNLYLGCVS